MKRFFLEISSGQGPEECRLLAALLARHVGRRLVRAGIAFRPVEVNGEPERNSLRSILFELEGAGIAPVVAPLCGTVQWIATSPFRPHHKRRNWFAGIRCFEADPELAFRPGEAEVTVSRSSGPGGQHVNTTNTKVQARHKPTGLCSVAAEERSLHQNRRMALARLAVKLAEANAAVLSGLGAKLWRGHRGLERGNSVLVIRGDELWELAAEKK